MNNTTLMQLVEAGQRISTVLERQEVIHTVLDSTVNLISGIELAALFYRPSFDAELIPTGLTGDGRWLDFCLPINEALVLDVIQRHEDLYEPRWQTGDDQSSRSLFIQPLTLAGAPSAALAVVSRPSASLNADDRQLLKMLAGFAASALQNTRLYEEARKSDELEVLYETGQAISRTLSLQDTLTTTMAIGRSLTGASFCSIYLYNLATEDHSVDSVVTLDGDIDLGETDRRRAAEIAVRTFRNNYLVCIDEPALHEELTDSTEADLELEIIQSWLAVPLIPSDSPVGVLVLGSERPYAFGSNDTRLMQIIASQAAAAIENALLYEKNAHLFSELSSAYIDLARKQEEILRGHRILQALFDGITDGLYIVDRNQRIIMINQAEARRLGQSPDELAGHFCNTALWAEAAEMVNRIVLNTFETGEEENWESQMDIAIRGLFTDRDVRTYPIFSPAREVVQVIIFAQDVSEKRRLQASLFRSANLAAVGQLASSIAHQINNPLTVIIANAQIMEMDTNPDSLDYPALQHVVEAGLQIRQIVQNLLDFSTQESYEWFATEVQKTIDDSLSLVAHSLRKCDIEVVQQIEDLPVILASASHLKLLWMNLLLNARDAIAAGQAESVSPQKTMGGSIQIVGRRSSPHHIQIQITDNGVGIPSQNLDHVFHPFFTTKSNKKNLGLGLYTCRSVVEAHQGQIDIGSETGSGSSGTMVTVTLPVELKPA